MRRIFGNNEYHDIYVLSDKGIRDIRAINIGDYVYEFGTSNKLKVQGIKRNDVGILYKITYSDGRYQLVSDNDIIFDGNKSIPLFDLMRYGINYPKIKQTAVDFNKDGIQTHPSCDPYLAGVLYGYGDFNFDYVNIPKSLCEKDLMMYILNIFGSSIYPEMSKDDPDIICFKNKVTNELLMWTDVLFKPKKKYPWQTEVLCARNIFIPEEYFIMSIKNRWQFIRGIFDAGYKVSTHPDYVVISNRSESRLIEIQNLLWSLGISSRLFYDPLFKNGGSYEIAYNIHNYLEILHDRSLDKYPGLFYDFENIRYFIEYDNTVIDHLDIFKLSIDKIEREATSGYTYDIILEKPSVYYTPQFLPRVSL